ncbi:hypothetical protein BKA81DRAFT_365109 [Phyllosticta paracitricarpa]
MCTSLRCAALRLYFTASVVAWRRPVSFFPFQPDLPACPPLHPFLSVMIHASASIPSLLRCLLLELVDETE